MHDELIYAKNLGRVKISDSSSLHDCREDHMIACLIKTDVLINQGVTRVRNLKSCPHAQHSQTCSVSVHLKNTNSPFEKCSLTFAF